MLLAGQITDILTTAVDRSRGTLESMSLSARLLEEGGLTLLLGTKLVLVGAVAGLLVLAARRVQPGRNPSQMTFRVALVAVQAATVGLVWVSLNNVALLSSLSS